MNLMHSSTCGRVDPRRAWRLVLLLVASSPLVEAAAASEEEPRAVRLEQFDVLGSRIRQTDVTGPSPVNTFDRDYIRSTGALTLADFVNRMPQNYSGISAGRGSTPNELNPEFGSRTETSTPPFNLITGISSVPATATGQSGVSLRGLGSGSTLVLIDGRRVAKSSVGNAGTDSRQGFVDLNTIPLGMVERVEVITDGASALYGADAVGGVINIVLKKDWSGTELNGSYKGAFDGGGHERNASLLHGFSHGKLRGSVSLDYYRRAALKASQRPFSARQDHSSVVEGIDPVTGAQVMGSNFLLNWGYPATVQARTGNLTGITANGVATRVALTPPGLTTTPTTTSGFVGVGPTGTATLANASGARRGNTAEFLDVIPPSERMGASVRLTYALPYNLEAYTNVLYSDVQGSFSGQPAIFSASATTGFGNFASIVPAAYNPFGQDVLVGMIAYEFGAIVQESSTESYNVLAGLKGTFGETWRWDAAVGWQEQTFGRVTRDFNGALITAALANPDASQRINPFVDARAPGAPDQSALFDRMARYITFDGESELRTFDFSMDGGLFPVPGGLVRAAAGLYFEEAKNTTASVTPSVALVPVIATANTFGKSNSKAVYTEVSVPFFGKPNARPLLERLDLQLAARREDRGAAGTATVPKLGVSWVPVKSLLLRAGYSEGFRAPGITETQVQLGAFTNNSLVDPRRGNSVTTGVRVTRDANPYLKPETSENFYYGLLFEPVQLPGLNLQVNYYRTEQNDVILVLTEQLLVNNEASFPGRVIRAAPDATDIANRWPGRVTEVSRSLVNFGRVINHSIDFSSEYRIPRPFLGQWRVGFNASRTLKSLREVTPGVSAIDDLGDTYSPPKWRLSGLVNWSAGNVSASVFANYLSSFGSNRAGNTRSPLAIPSQMVVDARVGYEFADGIWRGYGRGTRLSLGIGNVFDEAPPFADTVFGYNGALHSPLGRTYQTSFSIPF
jgi:iron complex outermembrane recepter protein